MHSRIKITLKDVIRKKPNKIRRYRKVSKKQIYHKFYIAQEHEYIENEAYDLQDRMSWLMETMEWSAEKSFKPLPAKQKQPYLSKETWTLIEHRETAAAEGNDQLVKKLTNNIKHKSLKIKRRSH